MSAFKLSIIIPTFNRAEYLKLCLESILKQNLFREKYEIIVIDNGPSTDETAKYLIDLQKKNKNIYYFQTKKQGCTFARNFGAKRARGEILLTTDDDIEVLNNNALDILIDTFEKNENIGVVGSVELKEKDDQTNFQKKDLDFKRLGKITKWGNFYTGFEKLYNLRELVEVDHVRSAFMAFRKELYNRVKGFEEIYNANGMGFRYESDFCLRVKNLGFKVVAQPQIKIWHKGAPRSVDFQRGKGECYLLLGSRNHIFFMINFFWQRHPIFWFWYDFLIGSNRTPGIFYLLKQRKLNFSNLKSIWKGKRWGYNMYLTYSKKDD